MNTLIISAFAGCGKTYLYNEQHRMRFSYNGETKYYSFLDSDSSKFEKEPDWVDTYMDHIKSKIGTVDFIFVANHDCVLQALKESGLPFVVVTPDNSPWLDNKERKLIKQQWFGRFVLRDNSHITDFPAWLNHLMERYDVKTSPDHVAKFNPVAHFILKENQYLSDIIQDLYWKKETYTERYCCKESFHAKDIPVQKRRNLEDLKPIRLATQLDAINKLESQLEEMSSVDFSNLRYTMGDLVKMLYGSYSEENAVKTAEVIGITGKAMLELIKTCQISKEDFEKVCDYLQPDFILKECWYRHYVIKEEL